MRSTNEQEVDCLQLVLGKVLATGVDVDTRFADRKAATPLMLAARTGNLLVLKALLNAGADPRCEQWSPKGHLFCPTLALHLSILRAVGTAPHSYTALFRRLQDNEGCTATMYAVDFSWLACLQALVEAEGQLQPRLLADAVWVVRALSSAQSISICQITLDSHAHLTSPGPKAPSRQSCADIYYLLLCCAGGLCHVRKSAAAQRALPAPAGFGGLAAAARGRRLG